MLNFTFENPTQILFGEGKIGELASKIPKGKKILVTYGGGSIKSNGVYEQLIEALKGFEWGEFGGIEPNPQYKTLLKAVEMLKKDGYDFLLPVGGGSVVDGTKFIAAAAYYQGEDPWNILAKGEAVTETVPLGCVLTLPATGSESNATAVVSRDKEKLFFYCASVRPLFAVLDPMVTFSLSKRQIANGVIDAFVHVMEQYLTFQVDAKVHDRFSEGLLLTLIEEGPRALSEPDNKEVRANIMWAATLALNGLIGAGVPQDWTTHMIGHEITGHFGVDHGRTLTIVLPALMKVRRKQKEDKLIQYAERIFGITNGSVSERVDEAIARTVGFFKKMAVPTSLAEVNLDEKAIDTIVKSLASHGRIGMGEHHDIGLEECREILRVAL